MLLLRAIVTVFRTIFTTRADLMVENLALRQQLNVLRRKSGRPRLRKQDRIFWLWLARSWSERRDRLIVVKSETVVRWHRHGFKYYWTWKSRRRGGRPAVPREVRDLIRRISKANPLNRTGFTGDPVLPPSRPEARKKQRRGRWRKPLSL